jgi:hypothetical protein
MESPQSAPDHSSPTLWLHQLFYCVCLVDREAFKRHYHLTRANSEIAGQPGGWTKFVT